MPDAMRAIHRWVPAAILVVGVALSASARRQQRIPLQAPLRTIALPVAGFTSDDREIAENERRVAGMTDYLFRVYRGSREGAFSVYVGYYDSQATGRTIHSPRNCLPGAGWQAVQSGVQDLDLGGRSVTVNRYILANGEAQALVYYWYQGRGRVAWSEYRVKWDLLRDAATRGRTEEALVRIVVPIPPARGFTDAEWRARQASADEIATRVAKSLISTVEGALPSWGGPET